MLYPHVCHEQVKNATRKFSVSTWWHQSTLTKHCKEPNCTYVPLTPASVSADANTAIGRRMARKRIAGGFIFDFLYEFFMFGNSEIL